MDSFTAPLGEVSGSSISSDRIPVVEVDLSGDIQLQITRTLTTTGDYYLGIIVTQSDGLGSQSTGVIGKKF